MKILCVGGGSGGHVTPVVAVIDSIKSRQPDAEIHFITDKHFFTQAKQLMAREDVPVSIVAAGKLRRYANLKWHDHLRHIFISYIPNFFDFFKIIIGTIQSQIKILSFRPDVIFIKGGYVGLPVGLAAALLWPRVPIVLHDSDVAPGLTNRVLSRYAQKITTAMPIEFYNYDVSKTEYVGMPIRSGIKPANAKERMTLKDKLKFDPNSPLLLAMGGGQGSRTINQAVVASYPRLKGRAEVLLITGDNNLADVRETIKQNRRNFIKFHTEGFIGGQRNIDLERAADIMITRAGATTLAEMARLAKPTIIIPSPYLAADHQTKNAEIFAESGAAIVIPEDQAMDPGVLAGVVIDLLSDKVKQKSLSESIKKFDRADAADAMADIIIGVGSSVKEK